MLESKEIPFDHVFDLSVDEPLIINGHTKLYYNGLSERNSSVAKFAIHAPQEVCIMRLELFAKNIQTYNQILTVDYGEKINFTDKELALSFLPIGKGQVKVGVHSAEKLEVKKTYFN